MLVISRLCQDSTTTVAHYDIKDTCLLFETYCMQMPSTFVLKRLYFHIPVTATYNSNDTFVNAYLTTHILLKYMQNLL